MIPKQTPADIIFKKLYRVRVPTLATYTESELEVLGIPVDIDADGKEHDGSMEMRVVEMSIARLLEIYENGFPIRVINNNDVHEIYHVIQEHIGAFNNFVRRSPNQARIVPYEDLERLDNFANEIFGNNKRRLVNAEMVKPDNGFDTGLGDMMMRSDGKIAGKVKPSDEIDYDSIEHQSQVPKPTQQRKYALGNLLSEE